MALIGSCLLSLTSESRQAIFGQTAGYVPFVFITFPLPLHCMWLRADARSRRRRRNKRLEMKLREQSIEVERKARELVN